jgi:lysophospholipase
VGAEYEEHFFTTRDGIRLFFRRWFVEQAKGLVALIHGFAEHSGRYTELARDLNEAGWSVAAFDYRGHGQSGGRRAHVDRFSEYLDDFISFLEEIRKSGHSGLPIVLGHSLGGLIAARFSQTNSEIAAGIILSSPFLAMAFKVPRVKALAGKALASVFPTLSLKTGLDPGVLSHDRAVVEKYAADPLVSNVASARWFTETLSAQETAVKEAGLVKGPLLVMQAGEDKLSSVDMTKHFFQQARTEDKVLHLYEGYFHEIFNEVGRKKVVDDLKEWLESHRQ